MSILSKLSNLKKAADVAPKTAMTDAQVKALATELKEANRVNVYPNQFDIDKPYRVVVRKGKEYTNHGYFTDADVASAVGSLCGVAAFGDKALAGDFDAEKVEAHEEFQAWMADDRNAEVIAAAS
jgi:hypothetical protein